MQSSRLHFTRSFSGPSSRLGLKRLNWGEILRFVTKTGDVQLQEIEIDGLGDEYFRGLSKKANWTTLARSL